MNDNIKIFTILSNGTKVEYSVVLTFKSSASNKEYCIYTDNTFDKEKKLRFYVAIYNHELSNPFLGEPHSIEEWNEIRNVINSIIPLK